MTLRLKSIVFAGLVAVAGCNSPEQKSEKKEEIEINPAVLPFLENFCHAGKRIDSVYQRVAPDVDSLYRSGPELITENLLAKQQAVIKIVENEQSLLSIKDTSLQLFARIKICAGNVWTQLPVEFWIEKDGRRIADFDYQEYRNQHMKLEKQ